MEVMVVVKVIQVQEEVAVDGLGNRSGRGGGCGG